MAARCRVAGRWPGFGQDIDDQGGIFMATDRKQGWYVRRGERVAGPYPSDQLRRFREQGKLHSADMVSVDGEHWRPLPQVIALPPSDADQAPATAAAAGSEPPGAVHRYLQQQRKTGALTAPAPFWPVAVILLALTVGVALVPTQPERDGSGVDCDQPPGPGVRWAFCDASRRDLRGADLRGSDLQSARFESSVLIEAQLQGADLSFGDLRGSDLSGADLSGARLTGADLRGAGITRVMLRGADLAYANLSGARLERVDLTNARLDEALWVDGRRCAPGSIGRCRPASSAASR